jgi:hypothetical protein
MVLRLFKIAYRSWSVATEKYPICNWLFNMLEQHLFFEMCVATVEINSLILTHFVYWLFTNINNPKIVHWMSSGIGILSTVRESLSWVTQFIVSYQYRELPSLLWVTQFIVSYPVYRDLPSLSWVTQFIVSYPVYRELPSLSWVTQFIEEFISEDSLKVRKICIGCKISFLFFTLIKFSFLTGSLKNMIISTSFLILSDEGAAWIQPVHLDRPICLNIGRLLRLGRGYAVAQWVNAVRCKAESLGYDFKRTMAVGLTQLVREMTTRSICWEVNVADA